MGMCARAQLTPITCEPGAYGNTWTWTTFENSTNPPTTIGNNPDASGINTSATVLKFNALQAGNPWAGFETTHGAGIGTFNLDATNCIVKVMVYKPIISDVGVKFATAAGASTGEIKVANTKINTWEELTFDFTSQIGLAPNIGIDQLIIFPDFQARTSDNTCYIDNIKLGTGVAPVAVSVTFEVSAVDTLPVYLFGNWNNWNNFPGVPMPYDANSNSYKTTNSFAANSTIEYLFVNALQAKEQLNASWSCTNGNVQYTNRLLTLGSADTTVCAQWASCNACFPAALWQDVFSATRINYFSEALNVTTSAGAFADAIEIFDLQGRSVCRKKLQATISQQLNLPLPYNTVYIAVLHQGVKSKSYLFCTK